MAYQREVGASSEQASDYHDLASKIVAFLTSQHAATVAINAAGTGYVVGDTLTLTHASAVLPARFEVTSVGGSGDITGLRIVSSGAFAERAASAVVAVAGSGYAVGDVLEVQGGTAREKAKFQVATLSGSGVATVTLFETGGAYSSTPANDASTVGIGPSGFAGDDACELTVTYQAIIGTTALSVTGGSGSSATVDITLAETGWSTDDRNNNSLSENGVTNEKEIVLVGDASGFTNKPYIGMLTGTRTSGVDTRYFIGVYGMTAHNPSLEFWEAPGMSPGINTSTGALLDEAGKLQCTENQAQSMDFTLSANDRRVWGVVNINPAAASTDDGVYHQFHMGFMNRFGTESEQPFPMFVGASSNTTNLDPAVADQRISSMHEANAPTSQDGGWWFYDTVTSAWINVVNTVNLAASFAGTKVMFPMAQMAGISSTSSADKIAARGPVQYWTGIARLDRGSPTRKLIPVPGSATDEHSLIPLLLVTRPGNNSLNEAQDRAVGQIDGAFWVHATDDTGAQIANFSEDYVTVGSDRYRIYHNHVHTARYQYIAIREDV